jgi:hypothetical protein
MEFLQSNFLETTTQLTLPGNTITADYLIDADVRQQFLSSGYADDSLTASITVSFDQTMTIDRIVMREINVKQMNIFYNGVTANAFALTGPTTTSQFTGNTLSDLYLQFPAVAVTSVTFDCKKTMVANVEKAIGQLIVTKNELTFTRTPAANDYTPDIMPKVNQHELSTGGVRSHTVDNKWHFTLKYKFIDQTFRDALKAIYDQYEPKIFVPFGTATGWDAIVAEVNWLGSFDFYKYSDNAANSGFTGTIDLKET